MLAQSIVDRVLAQSVVICPLGKKSMVKLLFGSACMVPVLFGLAFHTLTYPRCDSLLTVNNVENACWMLMWICAIVLIINYWRLIEVVHLCEYV